MNEFREISGRSLVTAVLPRNNSSAVIEAVLAEGGRSLLALNARGTLIKDRWYQSFVPVMNPEQEVIQFLAPDTEVDHVMRDVVSVGRLKLAGAGTIYSVRCDKVYPGRDYPLWEDSSENEEVAKPSSTGFKKELAGIFCIAEGRMAETISRAAVDAGAPGPTINYCVGRGLRDRMLLLRIAKPAEKEFIRTVVDNCDAEPVFNAMANAGRIDEPGRGFIYQVPIDKGVNNIGSVFGVTRHSASFQQIIAAIDELKGGREWRDQSAVEPAVSNRGTGMAARRGFLTDHTMLTCVAKRTAADTLTDAALSAGAPGVIVSEGRFMTSDAERTGQGVRLNKERTIIKTVLPAKTKDVVRKAMQTAASDTGVGEICFFTHPVAKALTYLGR